MKKSLEATFVNANRRINLDENDQIDACCRSLHKCDAYKRMAFNRTNDSLWNFRPCDCIHLFQICLDNLNTSLSNEVEVLLSINTTKCYTNDYPIVQCIKWESCAESKAPFLRFVNQAQREKFFNRCSKYELDENRPKQLQLRDFPFKHYEMSANDTTNMSQHTLNPQQSKFLWSQLAIIRNVLRAFNGIHCSHLCTYGSKMVAQIQIVIIFLFVAQIGIHANNSLDDQTSKLAQMTRKIVNTKEEWNREVLLMTEGIADVLFAAGCAELKSFMTG